MSMIPRYRPACRSLGIIVLLLLATAAWTSPAAACSCIARPAAELVRATPAVFEGRILEARVMDGPVFAVEVIVEPTDIWKGSVPGRAVLRSQGGSAMCGAFNTPPPVGDTILAAPFRVAEDGAFWLAFCTFRLNEELLASLNGPASERRRLDAAVAAAPGSLAPVFDRARFRENWDPAGAAAAYAALARDHPALAAAHLGLGRALLRASRVQEAVPALRQAALLNPADQEAPGLLVQARFRLGDSAALDSLRHFQGLKLDRLDITGRDLSGADFTEVAIDEFRAGQADLRRTSFRNAFFRDASADLKSVDLRQADLSGVEARRINLVGARLDGARLERASLDGARFTGASLRNARATDSRLGNADFFRADLSGARLDGSAMRSASFVDANLRGTDLRGANLRATDLRGADLRGANLAGANLGAAFHDCRTRLPRGFDPEAQEMIVPSGACQPR